MAETPSRTVVNFKESCVDPLAKLVMLEAMSFAVEKAESRLDALGKIFPGLADIGEPILQDIKDIRFAVENMNVCSIPGPAVVGTAPSPVSEPPPAAAIKQLPKREQDLVKAMPENLQTALLMELARKPGESAKAPDFFVKGQPVSATKEQKKSIEKAEEKVPDDIHRHGEFGIQRFIVFYSRRVFRCVTRCNRLFPERKVVK